MWTICPRSWSRSGRPHRRSAKAGGRAAQENGPRSRSACGLDKDARREAVRLTTWHAERKAYAEYVAIIWRLLDLTPADFDPGKFKITELIPPKSLGPLNSLWDLQHYVIGRAPGGLVLAEDGSLDWDRSFRTVDYFSALRSISVRNNVQSEARAAARGFHRRANSARDLRRSSCRISRSRCRLLWRDAAHQALILARGRRASLHAC